VSTCVSQHTQSITRRFCWSSFTACMPLLMATSTFELGSRCKTSFQWRYPCRLRTYYLYKKHHIYSHQKLHYIVWSMDYLQRCRRRDTKWAYHHQYTITLKILVTYGKKSQKMAKWDDSSKVKAYWCQTASMKAATFSLWEYGGGWKKDDSSGWFFSLRSVNWHCHTVK